MARTSSGPVIQASASNAAGATTTSSAVDMSAAFGLLISATITNGGTGPTAGCEFIVEVSHDNSIWIEFCRYSAGLTAGAVFPFQVELPRDTRYTRTKFTGNTGQAVTVAAYGHLTEAI